MNPCKFGWLGFGTSRAGIHAGSLKQAASEAWRLWPTEIPPGQH